jgi:hypothetical protein
MTLKIINDQPAMLPPQPTGKSIDPQPALLYPFTNPAYQ